MRIDRKLSSLPNITPAQHFFLSAWFNMVHQYSLDSFRVRTMNPSAMSREVQRAIALPQAAKEDRVAIIAEAKTLFGSDPVLTAGPFVGVMGRIDPLLSPQNQEAISKGSQPESRLLCYFLGELDPLLRSHYVQEAFETLSIRTVGAPPPPAFSEIHKITNGLLSTLLDREYSIESLFRLYTEILAPRGNVQNYRFDNQLRRVREKLLSPDQEFTITFAVDLISNPDDLPERLGPLQLTQEAPFPLRPGHPKSNYLLPNPRRRFMTIPSVNACDPRTAGLRAYDQLADVVNLLRFEYEQSKIELPAHFAVRNTENAHRGGRVYPIPRILPNPTLAIDGNEAANFVQSVNELITGSKFEEEGRDRITSAFRLYRQGRDQDTAESKLMNWWTALEFLVRGVQAGSGIGKSIEDALAPIMGLNHVPKHLLALRAALGSADLTLRDRQDGAIDLRGRNLQELFDLFRTPAIAAQITQALVAEPYANFHIETFLREIGDAAALRGRLDQHEQRCRWQLARIWRSRCDIVHSASKRTSYSLLCSNLEFYLKTTLNGLLNSLRSINTLSGPLEYFDREALRYKKMMDGLRENRIEAARVALS